MSCDHKKVYSNSILLTSPPQKPWICSKCGEEGIEKGVVLKTPTYDEVKRELKHEK